MVGPGDGRAALGQLEEPGAGFVATLERQGRLRPVVAEHRPARRRREPGQGPVDRRKGLVGTSPGEQRRPQDIARPRRHRRRRLIGQRPEQRLGLVTTVEPEQRLGAFQPGLGQEGASRRGLLQSLVGGDRLGPASGGGLGLADLEPCLIRPFWPPLLRQAGQDPERLGGLPLRGQGPAQSQLGAWAEVPGRLAGQDRLIRATRQREVSLAGRDIAEVRPGRLAVA